MANIAVLASFILATHGQESCDNYVDENGNWYWETVADPSGSYCRLVHCILDNTGSGGIVDSSLRRDEETSQTQINSWCDTNCVFADWILPPNSFCACPSCPEVTTSVPCVDDTYQCEDNTVLSTRDNTTCRFQCLDDNYCTTEVCCNNELMTECDALGQCDAEIIPQDQVACTETVLTCPDGHTTIPTDVCCGFNYPDCCIDECLDGSIIQGTYVIHGEDFTDCDMPYTCGDCTGETTMLCPDDTTINIQDNCAFDENLCCVMECSSDVVLEGVYKEGECLYEDECPLTSTEQPETTETSVIGCTEDARVCSDNTALVRSGALGCAWECPDIGCDVSVCCSNETMDECRAINECTVVFTFGGCKSGANSLVIIVGIIGGIMLLVWM